MLVFGALTLLLVAAAGVMSIRAARHSLAVTRLHKAAARADARFALGQAVANLALWPGMDACATAAGNIVSGTSQPRWTLCEKADGTRVFLVSTLPTDSHATANICLAPSGSDDGETAVYVPEEKHYDASGTDYAATAWWADDEGVKTPLNPSDARTDATRTQLPGACGETDATNTTRRSAFTLVNALDGGLREDLSALNDSTLATSAYTHPPSEGQAAWMRARLPIGESMTTSAGPEMFEPVVAEFALVCGLGADADAFKPNMTYSQVNIVLGYMFFIEVWNPFTRSIAYGNASPDIRVKVTGLPKVTATVGSGDPVVVLPDPLITNVDCYANLSAGAVQLLASPESGGGTNAQGAWQIPVGSIILNKFNYLQAVTLHFSSASPLVEFYDLRSSETTPFFTLKLNNYAAFDIVYNTNNRFLRSPANITSYGMGREAMNAGGWAFAYQMKLLEDDLNALFRGCDLRADYVELDSSSGDEFHYVLAHPEDYDRYEAIQATDFFATLYSGQPYADRQALFCDPPAGETVSFSALRHAPSSGHAAFAIGSGNDTEANAMLDRFFFSSLPSDTWDGSTTLPNYRVIPATRGARVNRAVNDAENLLLVGGWNMNTADAKAWKAVLESLALADFNLSVSGKTVGSIDAKAAFFTMPWSAATPQTSAAATSLINADDKADTSAWDISTNPLASNRKHTSFLIGVRDADDALDTLATNLAAAICARAKPFHSLQELAQSKLIQDAIDATPALNRRSGGEDNIPRGSPANIDQSVVLCALSPIFFTRSDTFKVRVYGKDETSGAQAWAEAVVQRLPTAIEGNATLSGRKFKIQSMRWMRASELE